MAWRSSKIEWQVEPMTLDPIHRLCLYPVEHTDIMKNYEDQVARFWTHHEINHTTDRKDWEKMNADEQNYIAKILAFFANSDNAVMKNINNRFYREITWPEVHLALNAQAFMESIHVLSYNNMIDSVIPNPDEKVRLFHAVKSDAIIAEKIDWITKWASDSETPLSVCFTAQCMAEGIGFSPSFASMFWLRNDQKCPGVCFGNEKIVEDESLHVVLFSILKKKCVNKVPRDVVEEMCRELVAIEHRFVEQALPYNIRGMNKDLMKQYVCRVADAVLEQMGEEPLYKAANPFPFMEKIGLLGKANFFEKRVSQYQKAGNESGIKKFDASTLGADLDF